MRETGEREWGSSPHEVVELGGVGERAVWHVNDHVTREFNCTAPPHHRRKREQVEGRGREELRCGSWCHGWQVPRHTPQRVLAHPCRSASA